MWLTNPKSIALCPGWMVSTYPSRSTSAAAGAEDSPHVPLLPEGDGAAGDFREQAIVDQEPGTDLKLGSVGAKELGAVLVGPVVEDLADVVDISADGLGREDVAGLEVHAVLERAGHGGVGLGLVHLHVLDEQVQVREALGEGNRDAAPEATHVDHLGLAELRPVVAVQKVVQLVAGKFPLRCHSARKQLSILGTFGDVFEVSALDIVCEIERLMGSPSALLPWIFWIGGNGLLHSCLPSGPVLARLATSPLRPRAGNETCRVSRLKL